MLQTLIIAILHKLYFDLVKYYIHDFIEIQKQIYKNAEKNCLKNVGDSERNSRK